VGSRQHVRDGPRGRLRQRGLVHGGGVALHGAQLGGLHLADALLRASVRRCLLGRVVRARALASFSCATALLFSLPAHADAPTFTTASFADSITLELLPPCIFSLALSLSLAVFVSCLAALTNVCARV
jgi:hypothetical protein